MKLKFKQQEFQTNAVKSVIDLFKGQQENSSSFSLTSGPGQIGIDEFGYGNKLLISDETILANLQEVQQRNKIFMSKTLHQKQFSIEMETGTGKTYVYTKTIFELNQHYGFTKFIIVVPSVAIREGVYKSFQLTKDHFQTEFDNLPYRYFIYNSKDSSQIRQFARSTNIEIMIINIDAFKKAENIINLPQDRLNGESAMHYIKATNPIVIIDEPQSVDNTPKAKEAIASLNPLCVFRYSATHRDEINLLYRLTPIDAYQKGLVKQICVSSNQIEQDFNRPYIALKSVSHQHGFKASLELDIAGKKGTVNRKIVTVKQGDDLYEVTGKRDIYKGYIVSGINCMEGDEAVEFSDTEIVKIGQAIGDVNEIQLKRAQIYRTIEAHLDKELRLVPLGIKVLSLFFIDEVAKYRNIDDEQAIYARMFEQCYEELLSKEKYASLRGKLTQKVENVHGGYFSQDKKDVYKDTKGDTQADDDIYNTIMRDKEWLLSFECSLRFIFSHSALKEGWDNPNVFQVCMLIEQKSNFTARQKIGRGLRLCVNQQGERVEDKDINVLHVVVNESFSEFVNSLQKELEADIGYKFGTLQIEHLVGRAYEDIKYRTTSIERPQAQRFVKMLVEKDLIDENGLCKADQELLVNELEAIEVNEMPQELRQEIVKKITEGELINVKTLQGLTYVTAMREMKPLSLQDASDIWFELREKDLLTVDGRITDTLKAQWASGKIDLSDRFSQEQKIAVLQSLELSQAMPVIRNASREVRIKLKKHTMVSPEFLTLWKKINKKTTYRTKFDIKEFVETAAKAVEKMPAISPAQLVYQTAKIDIDRVGVNYQEQMLKQSVLDCSYYTLPDIVNYLTLKLKLTAKTIISIIMKSGRYHDFVKNPQAFLERIEEILEQTRVKLTIDGIKYLKLAEQEYSVQECFASSELLANLERTAIASEKSIYDHVIYESSVEREFAQSLNNDPEVRLFFKLPRSFKIATPIGSYTPDWAVFLERDGEQKLYFVLETKGSNSEFNLRLKEILKIKCGRAHFDALQTGVVFTKQPVTNWRNYKRGLSESVAV